MNEASEQMPILDQIEAATSYGAIADLLVRMPYVAIANHSADLVALLRRRGFLDAKIYVEQISQGLVRVRTPGSKPDLPGSADVLSLAEAYDDAAAMMSAVDLSWWVEPSVKGTFGVKA